jgi:glycosyltransferase involved in cell wall biosynthesis
MQVSTYLRKAGRKSRQLSKRWIYPLSPKIHSFIFFELRRKLVTLTSVLTTGNLSDFSRLLHKDKAGPYLPLVTIIVPCFNHGKYLRQRLDSIYRQTYSNYEVILLDDHSTDESAQILNEFASTYDQNTFLEINSINSGSPFKQWSKGLQRAKGELIWIAESDDFCDPNFLSELVPAFINEAVMLAFSQIRFTNQEGDSDVWSMEQYLPEFGPRTWQSPFTVSAHKLVQKTWNRRNIIPNASATLFRRHLHLDLLSNIEWLHMRVCGDWLFYLTIARGGLVHYTPKTTNYYRQHPSNSSVAMHQQVRYLDEHIGVAQSLVSLYKLDASDVKKMQAELVQRWTQHHSEAMPAEQQQKIDSLRNMCPERKPNVLIVAYSLIPGGGEILPLKLANILHSKGHGVTVLNCHQYPNEIGIRAMLRPGIPLVELQSLEDLPKLVEELGIEVIHSHHPWVDTTLSELLVDNPHLAHVITSHGMYDEIDRDDFGRIGKILSPWVKKVSYVADKNRQPLLDLGFDESQLHKISNAIDPMEIEAIDRSSLGISEPDAFVVCLVSRAKREKGWQEAIEAVAMAQKQTDRPIHLLLVGEGVELQRLQRITTDARVHFLGFHSKPRNLYAGSDLGILPTFYPGESQPLTLIECLATGKPVIASDIGEIASMLTMPEGIAGAVIPLWEGRVDPSAFADQILIHADNPDIHRKHCEIAKLASEKFNPDVMAAEYTDLYEDAIKSCGGPTYGNTSKHYGD